MDGTEDSPTYALPPLPARPSRVLLFIAMEAEAAPVAAALGLAPCAPADRGASIARGACMGMQATIASPGRDPATGADRIGPIHAASALVRLLRKPFDLVVNIGTAGGFESQDLAIADLVLARDTMFHDARVALPAYGDVARAHARLSPDERELASIAAATDARVGLASTGSSLDATADELAHFARTRALAKDMELAALAVVCREEGVPLVALKGITDLVDHHEPTHEAFVRNLSRATCRLAEATPVLLAALRELAAH
jgi:nucleoside phosphorylase